MIPVSSKAQRTHNPIRAIVDNLKRPENHEKKEINLALGDPCVHGNLECPSVLVNSAKKILDDQAANGYVGSIGREDARIAIAEYTSRGGNYNHNSNSNSKEDNTVFDNNISEKYDFTPDDIFIASGCSGALELAINVLCNEGDNILMPCPGFPLYQVLAESQGATVKHYRLKPSSKWEVDLDHLKSLIDDKTKAIVVTNPSNPTGSNYSATHLRDICNIAKNNSNNSSSSIPIPIIADEIYGGCVYTGSFTPLHRVCGDVPVITAGGLAKEFVVPGWRIGWLAVCDKSANQCMNNVRLGLKALTTLILGASHPLQALIPYALSPEKYNLDKDSANDSGSSGSSNSKQQLDEFNEKYMQLLKSNSQVCMKACNNDTTNNILTAIEPDAAMYCMLHINIDDLDDNIRDDTDFSRLLLLEENVFVLPGQCFGMKDYVRLVICAPKEVIHEAFDRMNSFCNRHSYRK